MAVKTQKFSITNFRLERRRSYRPYKYIPIEMFVRILTVYCDRNNSYEITINGFQVRKINKIRNVIFCLRYGKPSSALVEYLMKSKYFGKNLATLFPLGFYEIGNTGGGSK